MSICSNICPLKVCYKKRSEGGLYQAETSSLNNLYRNVV